MGIYRIRESGETGCVGVIVAKNKEVADAFAQGKYGVGSSTEKVDYRMALESGQVCEVLSTERITVQSLRSVRVVA